MDIERALDEFYDPFYLKPEFSPATYPSNSDPPVSTIDIEIEKALDEFYDPFYLKPEFSPTIYSSPSSSSSSLLEQEVKVEEDLEIHPNFVPEFPPTTYSSPSSSSSLLGEEIKVEEEDLEIRPEFSPTTYSSSSSLLEEEVKVDDDLEILPDFVPSLPTPLPEEEEDFASSVVSKFFQLEELEDKESITTEIFLHKNFTVDVGLTNGPPPKNGYGTWSCDQQDNGKFRMKITRSFGSGQPGTDMGEFVFHVHRWFLGDLTTVGGKMAVSGTIHTDEHPGVSSSILVDTTETTPEDSPSVGYFHLIDTTDERLGESDEDFEKRLMTKKAVASSN